MSPLTVGATIAELEVRPSTISLMRFSAVTWNPHRIHYDEAYAATEGSDAVRFPIEGFDLGSLSMRNVVFG